MNTGSAAEVILSISFSMMDMKTYYCLKRTFHMDYIATYLMTMSCYFVM